MSSHQQQQGDVSALGEKAQGALKNVQLPAAAAGTPGRSLGN
jgi:hypothetical protein